MIDLNGDELLVLFECVHRMCETERVAASHPAEVAVLDKIASQLERSMAEPFSPDYADLLAAARTRVHAEYTRTMGTEGWVDRAPLEQQ